MNHKSTTPGQVLFIHGGGDDGYTADALLADSLQAALGPAYHVRYPKMPDEPEPDFGWGRRIGEEITAIDGPVILVGHSLGSSMVLKYLSENPVQTEIAGLHLIAAPFWGGDEDWQHPPIHLPEDFAASLPPGLPTFLYHCRDDEEVDFSHLGMYAKKLPHATVREILTGGHQLGNDLTLVAQDIKNLK